MPTAAITTDLAFVQDLVEGEPTGTGNLTASGTATVGATVTIAGGFSTTADGSGNWSIDLGAANEADAPYSVTATATVTDGDGDIAVATDDGSDSTPDVTVTIDSFDVANDDSVSASGTITPTGGNAPLTTTLVVKIDGVEYNATVAGTNWSLDGGQTVTYSEGATYGITADAETTDVDGDKATDSASDSDDTPLFNLVNDGADLDSIVTISALNPATDTTYIKQFADWDYGADGFGAVNLTLPDNVQVESQTESQIVLNLYEGADVVGVLTLNADGTDSLKVISREGDVIFIPIAATSASAGGPAGSLLVDLDNAVADFNIIVSGSDGDLIDNEFGGGRGASADDLVNTSANGWAVKGSQGQTNELDESILFSFVSDTDGTPYAIGDFKFMTEGYTGGISDADVTVKVFTNAGLTTWDEITINVTSGQVIQISEQDWTVAAPDATDSYVKGDDIYGVEIISAESAGSFRLNGIEVGADEDILPADLSFQNIGVEIVDTDGDTDAQSFSIFIDGDSGDAITVEAVVGTSGDDVLVGSDAVADVLIGGTGSDTLTGGTGADIFQWNLGDEGVDTVTDFNRSDGGAYNATEGDVLDLSDLLVGEDTSDLADLGNYISISAAGGDTILSIDVDGSNNFVTPDQEIVLTGVTVDLASLVADGTLVADSTV